MRVSKGKIAKERKRRNATFNVTMGQLEDMVAKEIEKEKEEIYVEARAEAVRIAIILLFSLPIKVLIEYFWPKSAHKNIPKFADKLLEYYDKWQEDEEGFTTRELQQFAWEAGGLKFEAADD